jgi:hypothetical protein
MYKNWIEKNTFLNMYLKGLYDPGLDLLGQRFRWSPLLLCISLSPVHEVKNQPLSARITVTLYLDYRSPKPGKGQGQSEAVILL